MYGGHWFSHFGHFFTETVTTLWPERQDVRGLVFHLYVDQQGEVVPWQERLVELAGYGGLPIRIVDKAPLNVERLVLPSRSIVLNGCAHQGCLDVWQRISAALPDSGSWPERVFLSRTAYNQAQRRQGRKERSSPSATAASTRRSRQPGFTVIAPETLPVDDQVRLARAADVLAGQAGTALHLAAFARPGTRVVELRRRAVPRPAHADPAGHQHDLRAPAGVHPAHRRARTVEGAPGRARRHLGPRVVGARAQALALGPAERCDAAAVGLEA